MAEERPKIETERIHMITVEYPDESCHWWRAEIIREGGYPQAMLCEKSEYMNATEIDDPEELRTLARLCERTADELEQAQREHDALEEAAISPGPTDPVYNPPKLDDHHPVS